MQHTKLICPCLRGSLIQARCFSCQLNTQKQHRTRQFHSSCCQCSSMQVCEFMCVAWTHGWMNTRERQREREGEKEEGSKSERKREGEKKEVCSSGGQRAQPVSQHPDRGEPWLCPVDPCGQGWRSWTQQHRPHPQTHWVWGWVTYLLRSQQTEMRPWGRQGSYEPSAQAQPVKRMQVRLEKVDCGTAHN